MRCIGRTKKFTRCKNNCRILFCKHHIFQPLFLLLFIGTAIIYLTNLSEAFGLKKPLDLFKNEGIDSTSYYNEQIELVKGMLSPKIVIELSSNKKKMKYYYHIDNLGEYTAYNVLFSSSGPGVILQLENETPIERTIYKSDYIDYVPLTLPTYTELPDKQFIKFLLWIRYKVKINGEKYEFKCHYQKLMKIDELESNTYSFNYGNCEETFGSPELFLNRLLEKNKQNAESSDKHEKKVGNVIRIKENVSKDFENDFKNFNLNSLPYQEHDTGYSIHLIIKLGINSSKSNHYILDLGEKNKNRISLFLSMDNQFIFQIIDVNSNKYILSLPADSLRLSERYNYINTEFGVNEKYSFIKILINGKEIAKNKFNFAIPFEATSVKENPFVLGADLDNKNFASFSISEIIFRTETSSIEEKNELALYLMRKKRDEALFFDGTVSMDTNN